MLAALDLMTTGGESRAGAFSFEFSTLATSYQSTCLANGGSSEQQRLSDWRKSDASINPCISAVKIFWDFWDLEPLQR